jgi:hypothetical protein
MDSCMTCGGAILEPNVAYGYAGPVCHCSETPRVRVRRSQQTQLPSQGGLFAPQMSVDNPALNLLLKRIEEQAYEIAQLKEKLVAATEGETNGD